MQLTLIRSCIRRVLLSTESVIVLLLSDILTMSRVDLKTNETELLKARDAILNDETTRKYVIFGRFIIRTECDLISRVKPSVQVTGTPVRVTPSLWRRRARTRRAAASSPSSRSSTAAGERRAINSLKLRSLMRFSKVSVRTDWSKQRGKGNKGESRHKTSLKCTHYNALCDKFSFF